MDVKGRFWSAAIPLCLIWSLDESLQGLVSNRIKASRLFTKTLVFPMKIFEHLVEKLEKLKQRRGSSSTLFEVCTTSPSNCPSSASTLAEKQSNINYYTLNPMFDDATLTGSCTESYPTLDMAIFEPPPPAPASHKPSASHHSHYSNTIEKHSSQYKAVAFTDPFMSGPIIIPKRHSSYQDHVIVQEKGRFTIVVEKTSLGRPKRRGSRFEIDSSGNDF